MAQVQLTNVGDLRSAMGAQDIAKLATEGRVHEKQAAHILPAAVFVDQIDAVARPDIRQNDFFEGADFTARHSLVTRLAAAAGNPNGRPTIDPTITQQWVFA